MIVKKKKKKKKKETRPPEAFLVHIKKNTVIRKIYYQQDPEALERFLLKIPTNHELTSQLPESEKQNSYLNKVCKPELINR